MIRRGVALSLALLVYGAATARPEAVAIDHKAVGCIVVGKYPKMNACFTPAASLARSRVYFRPEGTPSWYYVDMKSDQPCFSGTLPRPGKKLVGKKIEYYVEAQNKAFEPARTAEFDPIVVKSAQECKKNVPVAPFLNNATVAVFPALPAGFVGGGIGTAAVVGIVGAGAAVAGTAAVIASNNNDNTTPTIASSVNTTTTLALATTTTTTTTTPPAGNKPPNAVLKTTPDPPQGLGPLTVTFDMCQSSDPEGGPLSFFFTFGDGSTASGSCIQTHTYAAGFRGTSRDLRAFDSSYTFEGSVVDPGGLSQTRTRTVIAQSPPTTTTTSTTTPTTTTTTTTTTPTTTTTTTTLPCLTPTVSVTAPKPGACQVGGTVFVTTEATDPRGISNVTVKGIFVGTTFFSNTCTPVTPVQEDSQTATGGPPTFTATLNVTPPSAFGTGKCFDITATATNSCGQQASNTVNIFVAGFGCPPTYPYPVFQDVRRGLTWQSDLQVEGGRLQLIVNGSQVSYPDAGRAYGMAALVEGTNRVEATLVEGRGKAGVWRFELYGALAIVPGSLRVIAGDVVALAGSSATFRLKGTPGERIALTFDKK